MADNKSILQGLGALDLRKFGRSCNVQPHFVTNGQVRYLRSETIIERIIQSVPAEVLSRRLEAFRKNAEQSTSYGEAKAKAEASQGQKASQEASQGQGQSQSESQSEQESGEQEQSQGQGSEQSEGEPESESEREPSEIEKALSNFVKSRAPNTKAIEEIVSKAVEKVARPQVKQISVKLPEREAINVGLAHKQFPELLQMVASGVNVFISGPAGSGKTHAAQMVAKALGRPYFFNGAIDTEYKLSGFVDAQGRIVSTAFRRAYPVSSVYLFDEVDSSLPSALLAFNAALSNGACDFPGVEEPVSRHAENAILAAANTLGQGADSQYVGRNKLDAATLDRFVFLLWEYDEALEAALCQNPSIHSQVLKLRKAALAKGIQAPVSPRASINAALLVRGGMTEKRAIEVTVLDKLRKADREALLS